MPSDSTTASCSFLYRIDFPDQSHIDVVQTNPTIGETDEATVQQVKNLVASFPGAKVVGSIVEMK